MIEAVGWIASALFALCGAPQALRSYRDGHAKGVSGMLLGMWLCGELLMQTYVVCKHGFDMPLLVQYWLNTVFVSIIVRYKLWPRKGSL